MFLRALASLLTLVPLLAAAQAPASAPRLGTDYAVLPTPQPTSSPGKIEVVEVFSYHCGHCANFQPEVNIWKKKLAGDVRFIYTHLVPGGPIDNLARGFYTAEAMGLHDRSHDAMFKAFHLERRVKTGEPEEIADIYASFGAKRDTFLSTMNSFAINAKLSRAKQFAQRTGVTGTPTIIVAGKYRVMVTPDRGFTGALATTDWLVAKERAAMAAKPATQPAAAAVPAPAK